MALYAKYNTFVENLCNKQIDLLGATDTVKAIIHTDAPSAADNNASTAGGELTQIGGSNGYTTDGDPFNYTTTPASTPTGVGTVTIIPSADITWTASGGSLGASSSGRYFTLYDVTSTNKNPICSFDYGATFTVASGETMTLDFGTTLFTLT